MYYYQNKIFKKICNCIKNHKVFNIIVKQIYKKRISYLDNLKIHNNHGTNVVQNHPHIHKLYILKKNMLSLLACSKLDNIKKIHAT